jgi:uncharacterized protein (TIGR02466 family)
VEIQNLFPIPVCNFYFGREFTTEEINYVNEQQTFKNVGNIRSDNAYVLKHPKMKDIFDFVQSCVDQYFNTIFSPKNTLSLRITQSWFNYSKPGEWHHKHSHGNSIASGVFYINADKQSDKIHFYREGYRQFEVPSENYNIYNSTSWWFPVETGKLMLFPSSLGHSVEPVQAEDTRISLAFNTFPVGYLGQEESLTALYLES